MPYTPDNLSTLAIELAVALGDSTNTFWLDLELKLYLREALRTWHTLTTYWRGRKQFSTSANVFNYDLRTVLAPNTDPILLVPPHVGDLTNDIQFALMEPFFNFTPGYTSVYPTTLMYTSSEIDKAISRAISQWNFDTGVVVQVESDLPLPAGPAFTVDFNERVCDVRHLQIRTPANKRFTLRRQDEFDSTTQGSPFSLLDSSTPYAYSFLLTNRQPAVRIIPPSSIIGMIEPICVRSDNLPPVDWIWAVKWLALYFLLTQDGQCRDYYRATYCKKRYDDALALARLHPSVLQAYVNNLPVAVAQSPSDLDCYKPGWQNVPPGVPTEVILHGWNLVTLNPTPSGSSSITLELALTAPVDAVPIQLAQEHYQVILDYAKHLACFKMGGAEFGSTEAHYAKLFDCAREYNSKLSIESKNFWIVRDSASKESNQKYQRRAESTDSSLVVSGQSMMGGNQ